MVRLLSSTGIESRIIDGESAREMVPWLDSAVAHSIIHVAEDGYVDGHMLTSAYMRAARNAGVTLWTRTSALSVVRSGERIVGVETTRGRIGCKWLVDAAGTWAGGRAPVVRRRARRRAAQKSLLDQRPGRGALAGHSGRLSSRCTRVPAPGGRWTAGRDSGVGFAGRSTHDDLPADMSELMTLTGEEDWELLGQPCTSDQTLLPRLRRVALRAPHRGPDDLYHRTESFCSARSPAWKGCSSPGGCCGKGVSVSGGVGRIVAGPNPWQLRAGRSRSSCAPDRFGTDDMHSEAFVARCVDARANKGRRA